MGGGDAGAYQHKRSPYHLASWVYWQQNEKKTWKECVTEGARWAKMLSENDKAGPEDSEAVGQAKTKQKGKPGPPPVARADPHRNRHWKDDQDPEGGSGSDLLTFDPNFHANRDIHPQVFEMPLS